jgi:hypothetical protein
MRRTAIKAKRRYKPVSARDYHEWIEHDPALLSAIADGLLTIKEAENLGVSRTHFYRIKNRGAAYQVPA